MQQKESGQQVFCLLPAGGDIMGYYCFIDL